MDFIITNINEFYKNIFPDHSSCNSTCILLLKFSILMFFHKIEDFKHTMSSSADVDCGITGNVWRKASLTKSSLHQIKFEVSNTFSLYIGRRNRKVIVCKQKRNKHSKPCYLKSWHKIVAKLSQRKSCSLIRLKMLSSTTQISAPMSLYK